MTFLPKPAGLCKQMVPVGCLKKKDLVNKSNKIHLKEKNLRAGYLNKV